jgi:hypothetical protein
VRRLVRYLLHILAVLSLLVCVATCALWLKDAHRARRIGRERHQLIRESAQVRRKWWFFRSSAGLLELYHGTQTVPPNSTFDGESAWFNSKPSNSPVSPWLGEDLSLFNRWGFGFRAGEEPKNYQAKNWKVVCPDWFAAGLTGSIFCVRAYLWRRARKFHPSGHCPSCGYDLRATPDRCPECGTVPKKSAAVSN